jgi:hypothetical protein
MSCSIPGSNTNSGKCYIFPKIVSVVKNKIFGSLITHIGYGIGYKIARVDGV